MKILTRIYNQFARTPLDTNIHLFKNHGESIFQVEYVRVIESLIYLVLSQILHIQSID